MKKLLTVLALAAAFTTALYAQTPAAAPKASLEGTWVVTSMNGQNPSDQGAEIALVFTGNKYQVVINGAVDESGTFKLDTAKAPMWLDLNIVEGNDAGKVQLGIVEVKGDIAQGMLTQPGTTTRPADFNSNDGVVLFAAKKVK